MSKVNKLLLGAASSSLVISVADATTLDTQTDHRLSLYGKPLSLYGRDAAKESILRKRIQLDFARINLPQNIASQVESLSTFWQQVLADKNTQQEFLYNTEGFLKKYGISKEVISAQSNEISILKATLSPKLQAALAKQDYSQYLNELSNMGLMQNTENASFLKQRIQQILQADLELKEKLSSSSQNDLAQLESLLANIIGEQFYKPEAQNIVVGAVAIVAVVALVVTTVSAAVNVTVGVNLGAVSNIALYVVAAVSTAVGVAGNCLSDTENEQLDKPNTMVLENLSQLDPYTYENSQFILNVAQKAPNIAKKEFDRIMSEQAGLIVDALEDSGVFTLDSSQIVELKLALKNYSMKALYPEQDNDDCIFR